MEQQAKTVDFDGPCPFLTCLNSEPHSHDVCPECGAVRYGNFFCDFCRKKCQELREKGIPR